jgi:ribonuclease P protein component
VVSEEESSEAHLSAQRPPPSQEARLPASHVDQGGSCRHPGAPPEGPGEAVGLIAPLRDRRSLQLVREQGHRGRAGPVTVRYAGPSEDGRLLVAFAIGRHTGTAVVRNRIRRRLRAALDEMARADEVPSGAVIVTAGPSVATVPFSAVRRDLARALATAVTRAGATP